MKKPAIYFFLLLIANSAFGQYYLRGEIKDEKNQGLQHAQIFLHSVKAIYYSGTYGSFGITVLNPYDSLTISLDGYESRVIRVKSDDWQNIILKVSASTANKTNPNLFP